MLEFLVCLHNETGVKKQTATEPWSKPLFKAALKSPPKQTEASIFQKFSNPLFNTYAINVRNTQINSLGYPDLEDSKKSFKFWLGSDLAFSNFYTKL